MLQGDRNCVQILATAYSGNYQIQTALPPAMSFNSNSPSRMKSNNISGVPNTGVMKQNFVENSNFENYNKMGSMRDNTQ